MAVLPLFFYEKSTTASQKSTEIEVSLYTFVHQVSARYDCTP